MTSLGIDQKPSSHGQDKNKTLGIMFGERTNSATQAKKNEKNDKNNKIIGLTESLLLLLNFFNPKIYYCK